MTEETIGYCEGLCGGLLSHHLVGGLCPECRANPSINDAGDEPPLGVEGFVHVEGFVPSTREQ